MILSVSVPVEQAGSEAVLSNVQLIPAPILVPMGSRDVGHQFGESRCRVGCLQQRGTGWHAAFLFQSNFCAARERDPVITSSQVRDVLADLICPNGDSRPLP